MVVLWWEVKFESNGHALKPPRFRYSDKEINEVKYQLYTKISVKLKGLIC